MQTCSDSTRKPTKKTYPVHLKIVWSTSKNWLHFSLIANRKLWKNGQAEFMQWPRHDNTSMYPTVLPHSVRIADRPYHALTEINSHLLDRICFEGMTTLGVKCFFKGMRADHDMPTVASYAYCRRARCVEDDMMRIYKADFSYFTWPNSFYPEKIIKGKPPNIKTWPKKQPVMIEGTGSGDENTRREAVVREFAG